MKRGVPRITPKHVAAILSVIRIFIKYCPRYNFPRD